MAAPDNEEVTTKKLLKRLRPMWHELRYDEIRNKPYLLGKRSESDEMQAICSINVRKSMNFQSLKEVITDSGKSSVVVVIHSNDSTNVFYKCQMGLISPLTPKEESSESAEDSSET